MAIIEIIKEYAYVIGKYIINFLNLIIEISIRAVHSQLFMSIFTTSIIFLFLTYKVMKYLLRDKGDIVNVENKVEKEIVETLCWVRVNANWKIIENSFNLSRNILHTDAVSEFLNLLKMEYLKFQTEEIDLFMQYRFKIEQDVSGNFLISYIKHHKVNDSIMNIHNASLAIKFYGKPNIRFDNLSRLPQINLDIDGHFVNDGKYIYKKEECCNKLEIFSKFASVKDYEKFWQNNFITNIKYLPMSFMVIDKYTQLILFISIYMEKMFSLPKKKLENITDFIEALRGKIIPDSVFFKSYKDDFWNKISNVEATEVEIIHTLDHRLIKQQALIQNNYILLIYEDISNQLEDSKTHVSNETLINSMENLLVIRNEVVEFSSCKFIKIGMDLVNVNKILKELSFCINVKKKEDSEKIMLLLDLDHSYINEYLISEIDDLYKKKDFMLQNLSKNCPQNLKKIPEMIIEFYIKLFFEILKFKKSDKNESVFFHKILDKIYNECHINSKIKDILLIDKSIMGIESINLIYILLKIIIIYLVQQNDLFFESIIINDNLCMNLKNHNNNLSKLLIYFCIKNDINIKMQEDKLSILFSIK